MLEPLTPIYTAELFAPLHDELMRLLRGLDDADWNRQTVAPAWRVRDVVGHMLDVHLRKLSGGRDGYRSTRPVSPSFADITAFINELNAGGVGYSARLSPRVMTDLLDVAGQWVADFAMSLAPDETAYISVLWAGEEQSANWMDIGREYTEFWHHQMQIRDAVNAAPLLQRRWLHPLLDLSVRAFPRAYAGRERRRRVQPSSLKSLATTRMTGHSSVASLAGTCGAGVTIARRQPSRPTPIPRGRFSTTRFREIGRRNA